MFLIFICNTNIVFWNNQVSNNRECIYEKNYKVWFSNVVCKNLHDSSQKLISSWKWDLVKKLNNYVSKLSQSKLIDLHKNLWKIKQTEKNKDLLNFLSVLVYNTSEKYKKEDDKYVYNGFWEKIWYKPLENWKNPTIQPKSYEELATILNEKFTLDYSSFPAFKPAVYQYISWPADNEFTDKFYTFMYNMMYQSKDIKLPIYLIPGWVGFEWYGQKEYWVWNSNTPSITLDISKLPTIDIKNYPSLKYIVDNFWNKYEGYNNNNSRRIINLYQDDILKKYDKDVSKDFYQLLIDKWIDRNDITLSGSNIYYEDPLSKEIKEKEDVYSWKKPEEIRDDLKSFFKNPDKVMVKNIWDDICINYPNESSYPNENSLCLNYTPWLFLSSYRNNTKIIFSTNLSTREVSEWLIESFEGWYFNEKNINLENNYTYYYSWKWLNILYEIFLLKISWYKVKDTSGRWL